MKRKTENLSQLFGELLDRMDASVRQRKSQSRAAEENARKIATFQQLG